MTKRLARDVVIDHVQGTFTIDGHAFPYWMAQAGPEPQSLAPDAKPVCYVVQIPLLADNVTVVTADGTREYASPWPERAPAATGPRGYGPAAADVAALGLAPVPPPVPGNGRGGRE